VLLAVAARQPFCPDLCVCAVCLQIFAAANGCSG